MHGGWHTGAAIASACRPERRAVRAISPEQKERRQSSNFAFFLSHSSLLAFKLFSAVVTSQDLSFDTKFDWLKSHDTVPLNGFGHFFSHKNKNPHETTQNNEIIFSTVYYSQISFQIHF